MTIYNRSASAIRPAHTWTWRLLILFLGILIPFGSFAALAEDVYTHEGIGFDLPILNYVHRYATPLLDRVFVGIAAVGYSGVIAADVLIGLVFIFRRQIGDAIFWVAAVGGAELLNLVLKEFFRRLRPDLWASPGRPNSYSFPSGHAMASMALVAALSVLLWPSRWRWPTLVLGAVFVLLVGLSRIYLGVHFPSDVIAGWAASLVWVTGVSLALYGRLVKPTPHAQPAT
ncbi:MAG: phosphatase PAP2 family protein [Herpetosiphonaceae bacterium]|nr:phosphatase PAP2 family protein [Herpetosiphonaceae bacterium]